MLVRADAFPVVELVKSATDVDVEAAALWVHLACFDALNEEITKARPEINRVWRSVVAAKSAQARGVLVRKAIERRIDGDEIDDVVKAAAGVSLVRGYVAKAGEVAIPDGNGGESVDEYNQTEEGKVHPKGARGRFVTAADRVMGSQRTSYDALQAMTTKEDPKLRGAAEGVATQLRGDRYSQMRVLGNTLVATGNPHAQTAGGVIRAAAEIGPSAETVLGPHLRRVAYRYRGTEKRPDPQLVNEVNLASGLVTAHSNGDDRMRAQVDEALAGAGPGEWGKGATAARLQEAQRRHLTEDQVEMRATGDVASAYLMKHLPTVEEAYLSQQAGRTPPSIGVIIDRDGDVVSEAQGYNGDHYVPFDLKNLKRLHGGSYVRTRALGGPTSEDIYTGLLGGARQLQVVSRSGVFTLEFDPDLRGGRRYSDKAKQMVDRYSRILDRIEQSGAGGDSALYTQDVPEDRQREIRREALINANYDEAEAKIYIDREMRRERAKLSQGFTQEELTDETETQLRDWIGHQRVAPSRTEIGRMRDQITREVTAAAVKEQGTQQVRRLQLDAEGYYRAMKSLQREFPFYIRDVDYEPLPDFENKRGLRERGEPPHRRGAPAAFRTHVGRGKLLPAEQASAYGLHTSGQRRAGGPADEGDDVASDEKKGPVKPGDKGGGGAAIDLGARVKTATFQGRATKALEAIHAVNMAGQTLGVSELTDKDGRPPSRTAAEADLNNVTYLKYLLHEHGSERGVTRFLTEDANEKELYKAHDGFKDIAGAKLDDDRVGPDAAQAAQRAVLLIAAARFTFADATGDPALHEPDRDNPKPYPVREVVNAGPDASVEDFDKIKSRMIAGDAHMEEAFKWIAQTPDDVAAEEISDEVRGFKAASEWGAKSDAAIKAQKDPPKKPEDVQVGRAEAVAIAQRPKETPEYKELLARQSAWAWKRARDVVQALEGGGAAGPKRRTPLAVETGGAAKRAGRQVVVHKLGDPLSVALAKRLSSPARTSPRTSRAGRRSPSR